MKTLNGQSGDMTEPQPSNVETYWVVDVFGHSDKVKRKSRRPPTYNPEEYAAFLRQLLANSGSAVERLYGNASGAGGVVDGSAKGKPPPDVSDILRKLRQDLTFAFVSFCREFASDVCDGISLLMDILRAVQMAQSELNGNNKEPWGGRANKRTLIRNASTDELEVMLCLNQLCLANGHVPGKDHGCSRLLAHTAGFYGLALALVSHLTRTRSLALRLLTALCQMTGGHSGTSEALTTLRLNMGEPVRLKLLCGIINSSVSRVETLLASAKNGECADASLAFLVESVAFLNAFVQSAPDLRNQVVIQWEVEEAHLNIHALSQVADTTKNPLAAQLKQELALWTDNHINITVLLDRVTNVTNTNDALRKDLSHLKCRLVDLEQEKRRFSQFECDMKKRCEDLQEELTTLRSTCSSTSMTSTSSTSSVAIQTTQLQSTSSGHNCSTRSRTRSSSDSDGETDYDIDDVLRELNDIVDDAECDLRMESSSTGSNTSISTSVSSCSTSEEELIAIPTLPRLPIDRKTNRPRAESPHLVRLDCDLNGETSDFPTHSLRANDDSDVEQTTTRISRKQMSRIFFGGNVDHQDVDLLNDDDEDDDVGMEEVDPVTEEPEHSSSSVRCSSESTSGSEEQVIEDDIEPDMVRTIPSRHYRSSWNMVEARSPTLRHVTDMDADDQSPATGAGGAGGRRRRHQSMDNVSDTAPAAHQSGNVNAVYIHPTVHHSSMEDCRSGEIIYDNSYAVDADVSSHFVALHAADVIDSAMVDPALADLHIGDVFSFHNSNHGSHQLPHIRNSKKVKQLTTELDGVRVEDKDAKTVRNTFTFSNLIPAFLKSSFGGNSGNSGKSHDDWDAFQAEKALMKDYRQHFQAQPSVAGGSQSPHLHPEFWPPSFQAMPFRNIPQWNSPFNGRALERDRGRVTPVLLPSPADVQMQISRMTKLMDHPAGMY